MKKLLSIMLAVLLLAGLCVPALASGEAEEDALPAEAEVIDEPEIITEPGLEIALAAGLPAEEQQAAEGLEFTEEPETPAPDTEPAAIAEEPGTGEVIMDPAAEEPGPAEIEFIPDGKSGNGLALQLTAGDITGAQQSNVYFGNYKQSGSEKEPIRWRVLENANGQLFLLADQNLDVYRYHKTSADITWADSDIRAWLNGTGAGGFAGTAFNKVELAAIPQTIVINDNNPDYGTAGGEDTQDQVFLLSIAEVTNSAYGFTNDPNSTLSTNTAYVASGGKARGSMFGTGAADRWWLRSPGSTASFAALVSDSGSVIVHGNYADLNTVAVRPAVKVDLSSVPFASAAAGGKNGALGVLSKIDSYTGIDWKLTLKDESRAFQVSETAAEVAPSGTVELNYTGAKMNKASSAPNEYISAILTDSSGRAIYYGRLTQPENSRGKVSVPIPADLPVGSYTLKLFSEQYNGDYYTDYASDFCNVTLTVVFGPISGGVTIDGTVTYHGDTIRCSLTGDAASIPASSLHYQWQISPDKMNWTGVSGAAGASWQTPSGGTSVSYARVIVTADGYTGELVSDAHAINVNSSTSSAIEGSVTISQTSENETSFLLGKEIGGTYRNTAGVISTAPSLRYQWQRSANNANWEDIPGADSSVYTPTDADAGYWLRLVVTSIYSVGELYSDSKRVVLPSYNGSIVLKDLTMPVAGAEVRADAKADGAGYAIAEQGWYGNISGTQMLESFEAGGLCIYVCKLQTTDGAEFERDGKYAGTITLNGETVAYKTPTVLTEELQNGAFPIKGYYFASSTSVVVLYVEKLPDAPPTPAPEPTVKLSADATTAQAENFTGLYARVALVIDNGGVSGLYVTQATINPGGEIVIPSFMIPGLTVKGVSVALVPTIGDIQKSMPEVKASDMKMLG